MKKISFVVAAALAAVMTSCGNGTPKADLKSDVDTLSYAFGLQQTDGLKPYLVQRLGVDTAYVDEFVKGLNEGANIGTDKKQIAYQAGIQIGQQISQQMVKGVNYELFGDDSLKTISLRNVMAGFVAGVTGNGALMSVDSAAVLATRLMKEVKNKSMEERFGENKKACEDFMAEIAKKPGVKALENGVYYEVVKEGTGAVPADTNYVKVHYEGSLINDSVFDSSIKRGEPITIRCNQMIPGFSQALLHMPVGSEWKVYIPQDQAYGERQAGEIPPFSCLIFTIKMEEIVNK